MSTQIPSDPYSRLPPSPPDSKAGSSRAINQMLSGERIRTPEKGPQQVNGISHYPNNGIGMGLAGLPSPLSPSRSPHISDVSSKALDSEGGANGGGGGISKRRRRKSAKLEDFELIRVLGKGCAGKVLLVRHTSTRGIHAMKAISKRAVFATDELDHTLAELTILKRFATCPSSSSSFLHSSSSSSPPKSTPRESKLEEQGHFVSKLHYAFTDPENFYFVMEFYPGGDLATQLELHGTLGPTRTRFYACDITQGLEDLHREGIIVRDLKPENILLNAKGHAVLADFGLSKEFSYRGDPYPIPAVTYRNSKPLPDWAGQGLGSLRKGRNGRMKIVVDRAMSFVGTCEYLAPEVVQRHEYTYAVDWWALGCIILECMIGRVPFRKYDDESPAILYHRITTQPWDDILRHWRFAECDIAKVYGLDEVVWDFLNALLEKDPMRRLTEPYIKHHPYFNFVDWDTVRRGEYADPFPLDIHPTAEYNDKYFPTLTLQEESISVDMSGHASPQKMGIDASSRNAVNDDGMFKLDQARFRKELEGFRWFEGMDEDRSDEDDDEEGDADARAGEEAYGIRGNREDEEVDVPRIPHAREVSGQNTISTAESGSSEHGPQESIKTIETLESDPYDSRQRYVPQGETGAATDGAASSQDTLAIKEFYENNHMVEGGTVRGNLMPTAMPTDMSHFVLSLPPTAAPTPAIPHAGLANLEEDTPSIDVTEPDETSSIGQHPPSTTSTATSSNPVAIPSATPAALNPNRNSLLPSALPSSGLSVSDVISIQSSTAGSPRLIRRHPQLALASIDTNATNRLSIEIHGNITHLGDDDWEELEGESIPSVPNGIPSSSKQFFNRLRRRPSQSHNQVQGTFGGSRLKLGGRPKSRYSSVSDSGDSDPDPSNSALMISPTKGGNGNSSGNFAIKGIENTRKAFERIKVFPKSFKRGGTEDRESTPASTSSSILPNGQSPTEETGAGRRMSVSKGKDKDKEPQTLRKKFFSIGKGSAPPPSAGAARIPPPTSPSAPSSPPTSPSRPNAFRRHTESSTGWFDRRRKKANPTHPPSSFLQNTPGGVLPGRNSGESSPTESGGIPPLKLGEGRKRGEGEGEGGREEVSPKLELALSSPVLWDLEASKTRVAS